CSDERAQRMEPLGDRRCRRLAPVGCPRLVREAEQQDARRLHRPLALVEDPDNPAHDVVRHTAVHLVGELDEAERVTQTPFDAPREERWVDRQTVPADTWPRTEAHESEWLRRSRVDRRPYVDVE